MIRKLLVSAVLAGLVCGGAFGLGPAFAQGEQHQTMGVTISYDDALDERFDKTYGQREKRILEDTINRRLAPMTSRGYRVAVIVRDARPNRPTLEEMSDRPGLSFQSFGTGGASLEATVFNANGSQATSFSYSWFEHDIRESWYKSTWSDAETAIERFARRLNAQVAAN